MEFQRLFEELAPAVRGYARSRTDHASADDVVSETFMVIWTKWSARPSDAIELRSWVFAIARHKTLNLIAKSVRDRGKQEAHLQEVGIDLSPDIADHVVATEQAREVLSRLSPADREVLTLVAIEGLTPEQASIVLECSTTAMTTRIFRARTRLEKVLSESESATETPLTMSAKARGGVSNG